MNLMSEEEFEDYIEKNPPPTTKDWKEDISKDFQEWYDKKIKPLESELGNTPDWDETDRRVKIIFEYYDVEDNYIQDKLKLDIGAKSPHQIKEMIESTKTEEFFSDSEQDCEDVGLKLHDVYSYAEYHDNMKATMYIQFKVGILEKKEE